MFAIRLINGIPVPGGENNGNRCLMGLGGDNQTQIISRIVDVVEQCAENWGGGENVLLDIPEFPDECFVKCGNWIPALLDKLASLGYKTKKSEIPTPSSEELAVVARDGKFRSNQ